MSELKFSPETEQYLYRGRIKAGSNVEELKKLIDELEKEIYKLEKDLHNEEVQRFGDIEFLEEEHGYETDKLIKENKSLKKEKEETDKKFRKMKTDFVSLQAKYINLKYC